MTTPVGFRPIAHRGPVMCVDTPPWGQTDSVGSGPSDPNPAQRIPRMNGWESAAGWRNCLVMAYMTTSVSTYGIAARN